MLSKEIINWYKKNKRDLPWRNTSDPYFIWLSEIILQQTRVEQGLPYYHKFIAKYKTVKKLAEANNDDVMKLWQGLGYYNRASNMLKTAREIVENYQSVFPKTYEELIKLTGIGPYTAAAISSFAYNESRAVVDGNVSRVLSRIFAIEEPINSSKGKNLFEKIANEILDKKNPGLNNQAIMELGALVCKPRQPLCDNCPVRLNCEAFKKNSVQDFPQKIKKNKPRNRFVNYFYIEQNNTIYIIQRTEKQIWKGLFELPNFDTESSLNEFEIINQIDFKNMFQKSETFQIKKTFSIKHQLTHQTIYANFFNLSSSKKIKLLNESYMLVDIGDINKYAVSRLFDKFLNYLNLHSNKK
ncbi:MAG: A/G-specific adenine glycosylase [Bacteroidota bacterium]